MTLYGFELLNPHPDRDLHGFALSAGDTDAALLLAAATAVQR